MLEDCQSFGPPSYLLWLPLVTKISDVALTTIVQKIIGSTPVIRTRTCYFCIACVTVEICVVLISLCSMCVGA